MKKNKWRRLIRLKIFILISIFFQVGFVENSLLHGRPSSSYFSQAIHGSQFSQLGYVKKHLERYYVEKNLDQKKLESGAIKGMLDALDDPYTRFVEAKNAEEMRIRVKGEFYGIGIHIGMRDKMLTVISPIEGTPAERAGLKSLDTIISIDGHKTKGISLEEAVSKIRGEKGSIVVLGIYRKGIKNPFDISIRRDKIKIKAVSKVEVFDNNIGYIKLSSFESRNATIEVASALNKLRGEGIKGLILDLRYNGGGLLRNAINIASLFLASGDIVHTVDRDGKRSTEKVSGIPIYATDPLIILVNEGSASASEILAGAIKDNNRGEIIGQNTFGKASVQKVLNLKDGSTVLYTVAKYYTPDGIDITKKGISVDMESAITTEDIKAMMETDYVYSFETDTQLQYAIEVMKKKL